MGRPRKNDVIPDDEPQIVRFEMKLNLADPRERELAEILRGFKDNRKGSQAVKQFSYEGATGKSWLTGRPMQLLPATVTVQGVPAPSSAPANAVPLKILNQADLDALDDDLSDWGSKAS